MILSAEACPRFLHQGQIRYLRRAAIFSSGAESRPIGAKKFLLPFKKFLIVGRKREGVEYLSITKDRLNWASTPMRAF